MSSPDEDSSPDWVGERAVAEGWGYDQWREWDRLVVRLSELGTELDDIDLNVETDVLFAFKPGFAYATLDEADQHPLLRATHRLASAIVDPQPVSCSGCGRMPRDDEKKLKPRGWHRAGPNGQLWLCPDCWQPPNHGSAV